MSDGVRDLARPLARTVRAVAAWSRGAIAYASPLPEQLRVSYGHSHVPGPTEISHGGLVKVQSLEREFPNTPFAFNVLYLVSSNLPAGAVTLARWAKRKGARVVLNQNGVAYPGWFGEGWQRVNQPMRDLLAMADHVFYQSDFCKRSADQFAGPASHASEILHNAVDTKVFTPASAASDRMLTLLVAGSQQRWYRYDVAMRTFAELRRRGVAARLIVAGRLSWQPDAAQAGLEARRLAKELAVDDAVEFLGAYRQADAPDVFRRGDILLHTKYNDPCPTVVIEAMSCGLPVVFSATGGVPELVGDAGEGVATEISFDRDVPPSPSALADAVQRVAQALPAFSTRARQRAVAHLDLQHWMTRHRDVFVSRS